MARAAEHATFNLLAVSTVWALAGNKQDNRYIANSALAGLAASCFPSLPDILEPATSPRHRKFFHSLAFAALLGLGLKKLYDWKPDSDWDRFMRLSGLVLGSAYLAHLARDALTEASLPLV
jgi:membrane-bound metal-dependent hydrolase YbcI (DUF457 family)